MRGNLYNVDAILLSVGPNDVFQDPEARAQAIREPVAYKQRILERVAGVVAQIRSINPDAEILSPAAFNPIPEHPLSKGLTAISAAGTDAQQSIRVGRPRQHCENFRHHRRSTEAQPDRSVPSGRRRVP
jgi:hypothetical protein